RRLASVPLAAVAAVGRAMLDETPRTLGALGPALLERWPGADAEALAHAVRALVPLVQPPPRGLWRRSGQSVHLPAESWLQDSARPVSLDEVVLRYLGAYGPASVMDVQMWSG